MNAIETALFYMRLGYTDENARDGVLDAYPAADVDKIVPEARAQFEAEEKRDTGAGLREQDVRAAHGEFDVGEPHTDNEGHDIHDA